jgi:hypothetical protein
VARVWVISDFTQKRLQIYKSNKPNGNGVSSLFGLGTKHQGKDVTDNRNNLVALTQRVFGAIVSSADKFPPQLRSMCHFVSGLKQALLAIPSKQFRRGLNCYFPAFHHFSYR